MKWEVSRIQYLGIMLAEDGKLESEIAHRANKRNRIYYTNRTILEKEIK